MPDSKKPTETGHELEGSEPAEDIVLSTLDQSTPAALAVDEDGLFDIDHDKKIEAIKKQAKDRKIRALREESGVAGSDEKKPRANPLNGLLRLLRIPERWLVGRYRKSGVRKVFRRFETYRDFEATLEVENKLETVYGGSTKPLDNFAYFIRNNVLVTLLLTVLVGNLFVGHLSQPAFNRYSDPRNSIGAEENIADAAAARTAKEAEAALTASLDHCAVNTDLRKALDNQQDDFLKSTVLAELSGFIQVYQESELENWYAARSAKRDVAVDRIQSHLPRIQDYSHQVAAELGELISRYEELNGELKDIDVTSKRGINRFIRIRNEIVGLGEQVRFGPSITRAIAMLDVQALRLKEVTSGYGKQNNAGLSRWAVTTGQQDLVQLEKTVGDVVKNDIDVNIVDVSQDNSETKLYRIQILSATLRDFGDLIVHLGDTSNPAAIKVNESQNVSNDRLTELFGADEYRNAKFLDYENCLSLLDPAATKLTSRQTGFTRPSPSS